MPALDLCDLNNVTWTWRQSPKPSHELTCSDIDDLLDPRLVEPTAHEWSECSQMPTETHVELLAARRIPDPFKGLNESRVQWVGEQDWLYKAVFDVDRLRFDFADETCGPELVFESLDTICDVYLNSKLVASSDNMHVPLRVPLDPTQLLSKRNTLLLVFRSAFVHGRTVERDTLGPGKHMKAWNGDPSRLFVRKAGYHYGWDWGPTLMTSGPWKSCRLEWGPRIVRVDTWSRHEAGQRLQVVVEVECRGVRGLDAEVHATIRHDRETSTGKIGSDRRLFFSSGELGSAVPISETGRATLVSQEFDIENVPLWDTVTGSSTKLFSVDVCLRRRGNGAAEKTYDRKSTRTGFRRARVVQEPFKDGEPGQSFYVELNGRPIFCGGSNWIPIDSFLTRASKDRYRQWLQLLKDGNQNMIRVWGGGIYESDDFYDLCDEMGILVWQDFAFACGQYPGDRAFVKNVRREAREVYKRLRRHPCIVVWAGNNEDYALAEAEGLDQDSTSSKTGFPARKIYEDILPELFTRGEHYQPGSPWSGHGVSVNNRTIGDTHEWQVWHGSQQPYQNWDKLAGRFVSEFGMQALPDIRTIDYWLDGNKQERFPQSRTMAAHNKADGYERRLETYLVENIRHGFKLDDYVYATQFIQAECIGTAYKLWRRGFKELGKFYTSGALVWQLNDVWPCTSWSICDYFLRPKPAYFVMKRRLAPLVVGMKRYTKRNYPDPLSAAVYEEKHLVEVWVSRLSSMKDDIEAEVQLTVFGLLSGRKVWNCRKTVSPFHKHEHCVEVDRFELGALEVPDAKEPLVVSALLLQGPNRQIVSRDCVYPEPYKFLTFPSPSDTDLKIRRVSGASEDIVITANRPVKGLVLTFSDDVKLSDNFLDIMPGEPQSVLVQGMTPTTKISYRYLGDEHCP